jgi:hypothetical protein
VKINLRVSYLGGGIKRAKRSSSAAGALGTKWTWECRANAQKWRDRGSMYKTYNTEVSPQTTLKNTQMKREGRGGEGRRGRRRERGRERRRERGREKRRERGREGGRESGGEGKRYRGMAMERGGVVGRGAGKGVEGGGMMGEGVGEGVLGEDLGEGEGVGVVEGMVGEGAGAGVVGEGLGESEGVGEGVVGEA